MATDVHTHSASLLYCRLCGDSIKAGQRCRTCGGSRGQAPASSNMASFGRKSKGKGDPWVERYARGETSEEENTDKGPSPPKSNQLSWQSSLVRNATAFNLGVGMPSSISKDLKPSPTPSPLGSYASRAPAARTNILPPTSTPPPPLSPSQTHLPHSPSQPLMSHPSGGPLSKVCGTVLDPESTRNKWACTACSSIFARDSTIYAPPASTIQPGHQAEAFYCKDCYTARYSLGDCKQCGKSILGTTKEKGAFVKTSMGDLYHGCCFLCKACGRGGGGDGVEIMLDLNGLPTCEDCFGVMPRTRVGVGKQKSTASASAISPSLGSGGTGGSFPFNAQRPGLLPTKRTSSYLGKQKMGATIAELSQRFGAVAVGGGRQGDVRSAVQRPASPTRSDSAQRPGIPTRSDSTHRPASPTRSDSTHRPASPTRSDSAHRPASPTRSDSTHRTANPTRSDSTHRPASPTRSPQPRAAHFSRSNSNDGSNARYDLGAFKSTNATGLTRSDSRVRSFSPVKTDVHERSSSPVKVTEMGCGVGVGCDTADNTRTSPAPRFPLPRNYEQAERLASSTPPPPPHRSSSPPEPPTIPKEQGPPVDSSMTCAICHHDAFHGPHGSSSTTNEEAFLVSLPLSDTPIELHAECFKCAVCDHTIDGSKSFIRLDDHELSFAHPSCAPPATISRTSTSTPPTSMQTPRTRTSTSHMHPTLRSLPRPSDGGEKREYVATHSFVRRATSIAKRNSPNMESTRQFKSTSGAAPPTRSTLNIHRPGARGVNPAAGMFSLSSTSVVSGPTQSTPRRYGGMLTCAGCTGHLTSLESVPGPAGSVWHKKCLVCRAAVGSGGNSRGGGNGKAKTCGKQLDSFAKVRMDGEVRCASCFREGL